MSQQNLKEMIASSLVQVEKERERANEDIGVYNIIVAAEPGDIIGERLDDYDGQIAYWMVSDGVHYSVSPEFVERVIGQGIILAEEKPGGVNYIRK